MNLQDSVPERRNLLVLSVTTIIFYLGNGSACEPLKLPFGLINLSNNFELMIVLSIAYLYVILRYWLIFRSIPYKEYIRDIDRFPEISGSKNWKLSLEYCFLLYCNPRRVARSVKWSKDDDDKYTYNYNEILEESRFDKNKANDSLQFYFDKKMKIRLTTHEDGRAKIISDVINIFSKEYIFTSIHIIIRKMTLDKYLFDWYCPIILLIFSLFLATFYWVTGQYTLCQTYVVSQ